MKKSMSVILILALTAMLAGCFLDFGPVKAREPEIKMSNTDISFTGAVEFTVENWSSSLSYTVTVNGKPMKNLADEPSFLIKPEGEWDNLNKLTVTAEDTLGGKASTTVNFIASAKDRIDWSIKNGKVTLTPVFETTPIEDGMTVIWQVWFRVKGQSQDKYEVRELPANESLTLDIPANAYPEVRCDLDLRNGKTSAIPDHLKKTIHFPVILSDPHARSSFSAKPDSNDMIITFECTSDWDVELFTWKAVTNKGSFEASNPSKLFHDTVTFKCTLDAAKEAEIRTYHIEASYRSMDGARRTLSTEDERYQYRH